MLQQEDLSEHKVHKSLKHSNSQIVVDINRVVKIYNFV